MYGDSWALLSCAARLWNSLLAAIKSALVLKASSRILIPVFYSHYFFSLIFMAVFYCYSITIVFNFFALNKRRMGAIQIVVFLLNLHFSFPRCWSGCHISLDLMRIFLSCELCPIWLLQLKHWQVCVYWRSSIMCFFLFCFLLLLLFTIILVFFTGKSPF